MAIIAPIANDFSDVKNAIEPYNILADHYGEDLAATQLQLEHEAYTEGEKRFIRNLNRQIEAGEFADNVVAKPLLGSLIPNFVKRFKEWETEAEGKRGTRPVAFVLTRNIHIESLAVITIKRTLMELTKQEDVMIQALAAKIGMSIEDEIRFGRIREMEQEKYKRHIEEHLNKRRGLIYKKAFMSAVESALVADDDSKVEQWTGWTREQTVYVGIQMLETLIESTGLIEINRMNAGDISKDGEFVCLAPEFVDILTKRAGALAGITPMFQPCVVPPKPWTGVSGGGYWANGRKPLNLIRVHSKKALRRYDDVYMPEVYEAVNVAQNTPWKINKKVLAVVNEITTWLKCPVEDVPSFEQEELPKKPEDIDTNEIALKGWKKEAAAIYRKEKARISRRLSMEFMIEQANKFSQFKAIWFPYNLDWRGRVYACSMFNPQGNDLTKGVLTLAKGKPIGKEGFYWLKIHGANTAGVDKVPFPERIKFIEDNSKKIIECAKDPLSNLWWTEQDSPFCFLAFCFEYLGVMNHGLGYVSSLPLAFDGSCSGIQHFSAMLRDEIGGAAVNLLPSETVQDIYKIVADKVNEKLLEALVNGDDNLIELLEDNKTGEVTERIKYGTKELARQWLEYGVTRSVTKRSVMTLAYGSKEFGFRDQILEDTIRPAIDKGNGNMFTQPNQAAGYMAKLIWDSVTVTVVAAVEAMNWLKSSAKLLAATVKDKKTKEVLRKACPIHWVTPDGFPVWQEYTKPVQKRLDLMFLGSVRLQPTINTKETKGIDARKQEAGIAPNFVHSQDGSHLRKTVVHAHKAYGIESFALIHDSFGTIPADAGNLFKAVRETIVSTYEDNDVLADFYEQFADQLHESQLDKMPALPAKGNLNLQMILESDFAFA